jgi:hypothetical protein
VGRGRHPDLLVARSWAGIAILRGVPVMSILEKAAAIAILVFAVLVVLPLVA